jgi:hypothetical protein
VKILFLAANPIDVASRLRIDEEIREISHKIRLGTHRDHLELVPELAVRAGDLQAALLRHQPDIVHFSGHCSPSGEIMLEDENGNRKAVDREALTNLFRILKGKIRLVVLNACYGREQAETLATVIDFTIGMDAAIRDKDATIFAAHFYQSLAFGNSVKEAFELAVTQLKLIGSDIAQAPVLLVRDGANAAESRIVEPSRGAVARALLPWLLGSITLSLTTDVLRRFLSDGWPDIAANIILSVFLLLAIVSGAITIIPLTRPANVLVIKVAGSRSFNARNQRTVIVTGAALVVALVLWLSLPMVARYYNERGAGFQYNEPQDLSRARKSYEQAVRLLPGYAQAHYNLAAVQEDLWPEKSMEEYLLAIRNDDHIYPAYNNLARLYILRGKNDDYESALNLLSQAQDLAPQDENVQYSLDKNLGWANYALKHYAMAELYLRRAIALRGEQGGAAAHCLLAYVLKEQGKAGVADECFDCVTLLPGEKDVEAGWVSDAQECLKKGGGK